MAGSPTSASVPREVLRSAFHTVANYFDAIRREWIAGDSEQLRLLASGFGSESSGYAELMRHGARAGVAQRWQKLRDDADLLPLVLRYCDPSLRDNIQRLIHLTDLDAFHADRYGETSERWRQTWPAMDLGGELDELLPKLRAAGDAMMLPTAPTLDPDLLARLEAQIAAFQSIGSSFEAGMARVGRVIESLGARDDDDTLAVTLPELGPRDREAWQASLLAGMTQEKIADAMNKAHPGENWTQPRVSEAIKRAKAHAKASGLADKVSVTCSRAPARTLDPAAADSGQRTDGRSKHLREKARQIAKEE